MTSLLAKSAASSIMGTTGMTIFSILSSQKKNQQFREHEILAALLKILPINSRHRMALAWAGHYGMGMAFNMVNQLLLKKLKSSPTLLNGLLLGAANGVIGVTVWKTIFELHPSPPKINVNHYLSHLMLAHLVFAALSNVSMKSADKLSNKALI
jgi:hypothetical protein